MNNKLHCYFFVLNTSLILLFSSSIARSKPEKAYDISDQERRPIQKCLQIFYDSVPHEPRHSPHAYMGKIHSLFLQNLVAHFPHIQQYLVPIEKYTKDMLEKCEANIYLATYFDNQLPQPFIDDFVNTKTNTLWAGTNIWKIPSQALEALWHVKYVGQTELDFNSRDGNSRPGFYKHYSYKGEQFSKFGEWSETNKDQFMAAFAISQFSYVEQDIAPYALSWALHTDPKKPKLPYILKNANHWYMGDSPFSFAVEDGRYLIFADLLFDVLNEEPRYKDKKPALFRIEDIHVKQPLWQLYNITDMLHRKNIAYSIALIPQFSDPYGKYNGAREVNTNITGNKLFLNFLEKAKSHNASFIMHGVTHQFEKQKNPHSGMSGDDFEFWDAVNNKPIIADSPEWVIKRIQAGVRLLELADIKISAWEVPHYQASPLDYLIFAQMFNWNLGRITYFPHSKRNWLRTNEETAINVTGGKYNRQFFEIYRNIGVDYPTHLKPNGQFYPYEVYGDVYDQRIIPENLGNFQPFQSSQVSRTRSVDQLIATVKRNRVLRDVWASSFMHLHLLEEAKNEGLAQSRGDTSELERFIDAVEENGYEFISLSDFIKNNTLKKRNPTIEVPADAN